MCNVIASCFDFSIRLAWFLRVHGGMFLIIADNDATRACVAVRISRSRVMSFFASEIGSDINCMLPPLII